MSANYFSAIFSQNMQKTFIEYVTDKRIEKAKKLLRQTDRPLGEIAKAVGLQGRPLFWVCIQKAAGLQPAGVPG